ncbi:MAG: hypothetical protein AAB535_01855 [Patescibacteria group bacterium]
MINLLPKEYTATSGLGKYTRFIKQFTYLTLALFLVTILGSISFLILSAMELKNLEADIGSLKTQVEFQEATETRAVLLKDRLSKIKVLRQVSSSGDKLEKISSILSKVPADSLIEEVNLDLQKTSVSINFASLQALKNFFNDLTQVNSFGQVIMKSISFAPENGYLVSLMFEEK